MARRLVYCSMQIGFSVRAQLVVLLIVALLLSPPEQKAKLNFYILCYKDLCLYLYACGNSVIPISDFFFPLPGVVYLFACMSKRLSTD